MCAPTSFGSHLPFQRIQPQLKRNQPQPTSSTPQLGKESHPVALKELYKSMLVLRGAGKSQDAT